MGMAIQATDISYIDYIKSLFEAHADRSALESYRLPAPHPLTRVIIGMSGGADSTVLGLFAAAYLAPHYPNIEFVFTDTGAEPESCYTTLDAFERLTGYMINRIKPEAGLYELIEQYNGFLPNGQARWCTRQLKIEPLANYMKANASEYGFVSLAGIRFDESDRDGISFQYTMEMASAAFPFIDLEIERNTVFDILSKTTGIPSTYQFRSRSGCSCCFFQRNQELIGTMIHNPGDYARAESYEKLSDEDITRWDQMPQILQDQGIRAYYPVPSFLDIRKPQKAPEPFPQATRANKDSDTVDMFGESESTAGPDKLYAAFALYVDPRLGDYGGSEFTPGVYFQDFVTISTSIAGLKSALNNYHQFKMTTPMEHCDADDLKIVITELHFPPGTVDTKAPGSDSFTWKKATSYLQLRNLVRHCQVTLQYQDLLRTRDDLEKVVVAGTSDMLGYAAEELDEMNDRLSDLPAPAGTVAWEGIYTPIIKPSEPLQLKLDGLSKASSIVAKPAREGLEFDEVPMACLACSI